MERQGRNTDRPSERPRAGTQAGSNRQEGLTAPQDPVALALHGRFTRADALLHTLPPERAIWARAYLCNAQGDLARAEELTLSLRRASDPATRVAAAITLASVLRQTGRHAAARTHDLRALRLATSRSERAHATIGLAADAVGVGNASACAARLREAAALVSRADWRASIRLRWVRAEHALMTGRPRRAVTDATDALARARAANAWRHEAKSLLFLGAALDTCDDPGARRVLARAERLATRIGARPIADVARDLIARGSE